jgi:uncharacterized membrane protein YeaQ/YmgE (transglycosylase-associated protein family)
MNLVIWIAAGAFVGWLAFALIGLNSARGPWISALIGAAGGVVGGKVVAPVFVSLPPGGEFSMPTLLFAAALAAVALAAGNLIHNRWGL